jgi:hypothetical protein
LFLSNFGRVVIDEIALRIFARRALRDGYSVLSDSFGFFASMRKEGRGKSTHRTVRYIIVWFIMFSIVPSLLLSAWMPLID